MELEQTLIDLGAQPLSKCKQGKVIRTYLNGVLGNTDGTKAINLSTTGDAALAIIYSQPDMLKQSTILTKNFGGARDNNRYPTIVTVVICSLIAFFCAMVYRELGSDVPLSQGAVDVLNHIVDKIGEHIPAIIDKLFEHWFGPAD